MKIFAKDRITKNLLSAVFILFSMIILLLGVSSIVLTCTISTPNILDETILYIKDKILLNVLIFIGVCDLLVIFQIKYSNLLDKISIRRAQAAMLTFITVAGVLWVVAIDSVPAADSGMLVATATDALSDTYNRFVDSIYFKSYPYQLGYVFIIENLQRILGCEKYTALAILNILILDMGYIAIIKISSLAFKDKKVVLFTILLLGLFFPPILFCTFIYGNILSFVLAMWAVVCMLLYFKDKKKRYLISIIPLLSLAVFAKMNSMIVVIAICIILCLDCFKEFKWLKLITIILVVIAPVLLSNSVKVYYEIKSGVELGEGVPNTAFLAMGLQDSPRAPGWYNGYNDLICQEAKLDQATMKESISNEIKERIEVFSDKPGYAAKFFYKKIVSQWNEPTFQSIWISQVKSHGSPVPDWATSVYEGKAGDVLNVYLNQYLQILYCAAGIGVLALLYNKTFRRSKGEDSFDFSLSILPIIIIGGFLYHLLFEGKSQYVLVYVILIIPYAAYGICHLPMLSKSLLLFLEKILPSKKHKS